MGDLTAKIDSFLRVIMGGESGGDAGAQNPHASASGLFGYTDGTWDRFGGYEHARDAPSAIQWAKARLDVANRLRRYGGDWRLVAMSWYLPAAVTNPALRDVVPAPEAGNKLTPNQYADLIMRRWQTAAMPDLALPPSSGSSTTKAHSAGFDVPNPLDVLGGIGGLLLSPFTNALDDAKQEFLKATGRLVVTGLFVAGGVAMVVAGVYRASTGTRGAGGADVSSVLPLVAAAA